MDLSRYGESKPGVNKSWISGYNEGMRVPQL
jgi:hypothetical protein